MAALDFPASPSTNQTYSGPGGVVWVWDGAKWVSGTGTTVYAPVTSPVFLGDPKAPNPPAGDADTSVATTQFVAASVAPAFNDRGRNLLHNPLFNVAQRGAGPFTVGGTTLDRWFVALAAGDTSSVTQALLSDAQRAAIGDEAAAQCFYVVFTGAAGATNYVSVQQKIEAVRRLSGKTVTVSFWAFSTSGTPKLGVSFDQGFGTGGSPSGPTLGSGTAVTLSTTLVRYSVTLTLASTSGMTLGTNSDSATILNLWLSGGASMATRTGAVGVQSNTVGIWGVQLEIGSVATPLEKPDPRYDIANCQRFYQIGVLRIYQTVQAASWNVANYVSFPVTMRGTPTFVLNTTTTTNTTSLGMEAEATSALMLYGSSVAAGTCNVVGTFTASADL